MNFRLITKEGQAVWEGFLALPWIPDVLSYGHRTFVPDRAFPGPDATIDPTPHVYTEATHYFVPWH